MASRMPLETLLVNQRSTPSQCCLTVRANSTIGPRRERMAQAYQRRKWSSASSGAFRVQLLEGELDAVRTAGLVVDAREPLDLGALSSLSRSGFFSHR